MCYINKLALPVVDHFIQWCDASFLNMNASKTKEMFLDFRKKNVVAVLSAVNKGHQVEVVKEYNYLGTVFDDRLKFEANTDMIRWEALQCMYFRGNFRFSCGCLFHEDVLFY